MTKFFKILMNIILILFIAALCAVFIPPFFGISVNAASPNTETNMSIGTVAYGVKESLSDISAGNSIVISDSDSVYLYEVADVNADNGELTVRESSDSDTKVIELRRTASRAVIVVPFIGYILIALQSFEGLIIFALAAALIIILFAISRVVAKSSRSENDGEDSDKEEDDFGYFKELAASTDRPSSLDTLSAAPVPPSQDEPVDNTVPTDTVALDEEIEDLFELIVERSDDNDEPADEVSDKTINLSQSLTKDEEPAATETSEFSSIEGALEQALTANQDKETPEDKVPDTTPDAVRNTVSDVVPDAVPDADQGDACESSSEIELAIPSHTLDELLQEAYAKGEDPHVRKDPSTGITLVDYSSCL